MAYTYSKIATYTVGSGGVASIDFLNIPQTYTDLVLKISSKTTGTGAQYDNGYIQINGMTSSSYDSIRLQGSGSAVSVSAGSGVGLYFRTGGSGSSNTYSFGSSDIYISNYTNEKYKAMQGSSVHEWNATEAYAEFQDGTALNTSPITSIKILPNNGVWAQYSTFHLYGIKAEV